MSLLLPIDAYKGEIVQTVLANQVTVVEGATGSGKTTQLPIFVFEALAEIANQGMIGITEPRRIAATEVARYVASTQGYDLGEEVGSQIRFDNLTSNKTKIKYMTDGILLRELQADKTLSGYSVIVVDEAHERGKNLDLTLGLLRELMSIRSDLKIVIMSATIDTLKFSETFGNAPIVRIPGRCYAVELQYSPLDTEDEYQDEFEYAKVAAQKVREIHETKPEGSILVFMSGMDDISVCVETLEDMAIPGLVILMAHGDMTKQEMEKIFLDYPGSRKVIIGTNIIETSITVDGAKYAVDSGYIKQTDFDPQTGLNSLIRVLHSKSGCDQRAGRVGRTQDGLCIRLYSESNYDHREAYTKPEILRTELSGLFLFMRSIGVNDIENFGFIDSPGCEAIRAAEETLVKLGAIDKDGNLTEDGWFMAKLPIEPQSARMLISAINSGCVDEVLSIIAFLSCRPVFARPLGKELEADRAKEQFAIRSSDYLTWLKVYRGYVNQSSDNRDEWAEKNYLKGNVLREALEIKRQLARILASAGVKITTNSNYNIIAKCITAGLVENVCRTLSRSDFSYTNGKSSLHLFPGSTLRGRDPEWFVCSQIRQGDRKTYGINCQEIKPDWLVEVAPHLCTREIVRGGIHYDYSKKHYRVNQKVIFEGFGEICEKKEVIRTDHPRFLEMETLFRVESAWKNFFDDHPQIRIYPQSEDDFCLNSPQPVYLKGCRGKVVGSAYPFVRVKIKYGVERYYAGYARDAETAEYKTDYAERVWRNSNNGSQVRLYGVENYGRGA